MSQEQARHLQYAALPYRRCPDGSVEIMLITSRDTGRWLIPKGWAKPGLGPAEAAALEAREEGGLVGQIDDHSIGSYHYDKRLPDGSIWITPSCSYFLPYFRRKPFRFPLSSSLPRTK